MIKYLPLLALLLLTGCGSEDKPRQPTPPAERTQWHIGPVINRKNYSEVVPDTFTDSFEFPDCSKDHSVNYVTQLRSTSIAGTMTLEFEITGDAVLNNSDGGTNARLYLYFQREGDDWQAKDGTEFYRWWSKNSIELKPGTYTFQVPLDYENWGPVQNSENSREILFNTAKRYPERVGFTFGGGSGKGHGVCAASGQSKFVVKDFKID